MGDIDERGGAHSRQTSRSCMESAVSESIENSVSVIAKMKLSGWFARMRPSRFLSASLSRWGTETTFEVADRAPSCKQAAQSPSRSSRPTWRGLLRSVACRPARGEEQDMLVVDEFRQLVLQGPRKTRVAQQGRSAGAVDAKSGEGFQRSPFDRLVAGKAQIVLRAIVGPPELRRSRRGIRRLEGRALARLVVRPGGGFRAGFVAIESGARIVRRDPLRRDRGSRRGRTRYLGKWSSWSRSFLLGNENDEASEPSLYSGCPQSRVDGSDYEGQRRMEIIRSRVLANGCARDQASRPVIRSVFRSRNHV